MPARALTACPLLAAVALALGCATAPAHSVPAEPTPTATATPEPTPPPPPPPAPAKCTSFAKPGVLRRSLVSRTVDGGLGRWLGGVEVEPSMQRGRFRGWLVRRLYPEDVCYREVDVRPGDVVVKVNGKSVERPEVANEVFLSLRTARALVIDLLRDGKPTTLTFPIAEE